MSGNVTSRTAFAGNPVEHDQPTSSKLLPPLIHPAKIILVVEFHVHMYTSLVMLSNKPTTIITITAINAIYTIRAAVTILASIAGGAVTAPGTLVAAGAVVTRGTRVAVRAVSTGPAVSTISTIVAVFAVCTISVVVIAIVSGWRGALVLLASCRRKYRLGSSTTHVDFRNYEFC